MPKMNAKKFFLNLFPFLLVILSTTPLNAQEDFTATSLPSVELCPCSNQAYPVIIQNTGSVASAYRLLAAGDAAEWIRFNPERFVLEPGQKGSFFVFVNSVCNVKGNFSLEVFITTENGLAKLVRQTLSLSDCYNYALEQGQIIDRAEKRVKYLQHDDSYILCKNEQKSIPILISNEESFENRYELFLDAPNWAALNVGKVQLGANKSGIFLINLDTENIAEDTFVFKLSAVSELGKVQREGSIEVEVDECHDLELELEKEKDAVCGGETKGYDVAIRNSASLAQNVALKIEGPEWATFQEDFFALEAGEEKSTRLFVLPEEELSGRFTIKVIAVAENEEEIEFSDTLSLEVTGKLACYQAEISTRSSITNNYEQDFFFAEVKNKGIKAAKYDISVKGPPWVTVSPLSLDLNPSQSGNINVNLNPGRDIGPDTYEAKIILESNGALYSRDFKIKIKEENKFLGSLLDGIKFYRYYIYLSLAILILIIAFIKPILKFKNKSKIKYAKYKTKRERKLALMQEKESEENKKQKLQDEKQKEEEKEKKESKKVKSQKNKFKISWKKHKVRISISVLLVLLVLGILFGHFFRLFNAKYIHIYIFNFFYGYLYYLLIGIGAIFILLILLSLYVHFGKKKAKRLKAGIKKETGKKEKSKEKWYSRPSYVIAVFVPIIFLLAALAYFNLYDTIKNFIVLYSYYFVGGILVLLFIILLIKFYKPLVKFLSE